MSSLNINTNKGKANTYFLGDFGFDFNAYL